MCSGVAVEKVVGVERDDLTRGSDEVDARALHPRNAEIVCIKKFDDGDAEDVFVAHALRHRNLWQATEQRVETFGVVAFDCGEGIGRQTK